MQLIPPEGSKNPDALRWLSEYADRYSFDEHFVDAIITVESNWNPFAMRYEPLDIEHVDVVKFAKANGITSQTEMQLQHFSFGLGQLMGSTARGLSYAGPLVALTLPKTNLRWITYYLSLLAKKHAGFPEIAAVYNAGHLEYLSDGKTFRNQAYVDKVMALYSSIPPKNVA